MEWAVQVTEMMDGEEAWIYRVSYVIELAEIHGK